MSKTKKLGRIEVQARWNDKVGAVLIEIWAQGVSRDTPPLLRGWADAETASYLGKIISGMSAIAMYGWKHSQTKTPEQAASPGDIDNTCRPFNEEEWAQVDAEIRADAVLQKEEAKELYRNMFGAEEAAPETQS